MPVFEEPAAAAAAAESYPSLPAHMSQQFNSVTTSDVAVRVLSCVDANECVGTYHLHKAVLTQATMFEAMLCSSFSEGNASQVDVCLYQPDWITVPVLDQCFRMLYTDDLSTLSAGIHGHVLPLHDVCHVIGFKRGYAFCERALIDNMMLHDVMDLLYYCSYRKKGNTRLFAAVLQWLKMFFFHGGFCSAQNVGRFDECMLRAFVSAPDVFEYSDSRLALLRMFARSGAPKRERRACADLATGWREPRAACPLAPAHRTHRLSFVFLHNASWRLPCAAGAASSRRGRSACSDGNVSRSTIGAFELCECRWKARLMHDNVRDRTWISLWLRRTEGPAPAGSTRAVCEFTATVYVLRRTQTDVSHHRARLKTECLRTDLMPSISTTALDDFFPVGNGGRVVGVIVDVCVHDHRYVLPLLGSGGGGGGGSRRRALRRVPPPS